MINEPSPGPFDSSLADARESLRVVSAPQKQKAGGPRTPAESEEVTEPNADPTGKRADA